MDTHQQLQPLDKEAPRTVVRGEPITAWGGWQGVQWTGLSRPDSGENKKRPAKEGRGPKKRREALREEGLRAGELNPVPTGYEPVVQPVHLLAKGEPTPGEPTPRRLACAGVAGRRPAGVAGRRGIDLGEAVMRPRADRFWGRGLRRYSARPPSPHRGADLRSGLRHE